MTGDSVWKRAAAQFEQMRLVQFKVTILVVLFMGSLTPIFRGDVAGKAAGFLGSGLLAILAGLWLFWSPDRSK
jgi:hypothetical protein